jgi:hypothetical protein
MVASSSTPRIFAASSRVVLLLTMGTCANAQSTSILQGRVVDPAGSVVAGAEITALNHATGVTRKAQTDPSRPAVGQRLPTDGHRYPQGLLRYAVHAAVRLRPRPELHDIRLQPAEAGEHSVDVGGEFRASLTVKNSGKVRGTEVVQLYAAIALIVTGNTRPIKGEERAFLSAATVGRAGV